MPPSSLGESAVAQQIRRKGFRFSISLGQFGSLGIERNWTVDNVWSRHDNFFGSPGHSLRECAAHARRGNALTSTKI